MKGVAPVWLIIDAVKNIFVVPDVVNGKEFRSIQETPGPNRIQRNEVSKFGGAHPQSCFFAPRPERTPIRIEAPVSLGCAEPRLRYSVHNQAGLIAILSIRSARDQLHALNSISRKLRRENLA